MSLFNRDLIITNFPQNPDNGGIPANAKQCKHNKPVRGPLLFITAIKSTIDSNL